MPSLRWLACSLLVALAAAAEDLSEEVLIGWKGETYDAGLTSLPKSTDASKNEAALKDIEAKAKAALEAEEGKAVGKANGTLAAAAPRTEPWVETISWNPRAFIHHHFLTPEEADHLVGIGSKRVSRSLVVDAQTGQSRLDDIRTSFGAAFGRGEDPVIAEIEERVAEWTHLPPEHQEPMQILRYVDGQKYGAHWDWFDDPVHHAAYLAEGNRYATVVLYLSDVEYGGETNLPLADAIDPEAQSPKGLSPCASAWGISVKPKKGDALLFFDMDIMGSVGDRRTLHTACPAIRGTKWTATKWIHNKPYMGEYDPLAAAARCADTAADCPQLAAAGECEKNMARMVGVTGMCRASCRDCRQCAAGDVLCQRYNMKSLVRARAMRAAAGVQAAAAAGQAAKA
ncbi:hypothetical protein CHLRE_11g481200v5 [Chlamydomonas reinhardtii]|uniref:Fe2OG dioxygenase domain-containing protein n=1 Tax=Chlamydomonas reinhardtii TaxID=3055 RepID=A0A2K3D8Q8_CHLRE|nr:uncharacterized protein CHLRE_11g481200v5 [Chlamydomonas reinhardtii]PNW76919.1 hypothetical protein CHLRE_11g481200v5 [Chlamydomonas reinhardtii]